MTAPTFRRPVIYAFRLFIRDTTSIAREFKPLEDEDSGTRHQCAINEKAEQDAVSDGP